LASIAVFEAGRCYRPMYRWLSDMVETVVLAHPGGLKIISDTVYKDDKLDSEKLADLLMLGIVPEAHVASEEAWSPKYLHEEGNCRVSSRWNSSYVRVSIPYHANS
jgi:hypothetical protein